MPAILLQDNKIHRSVRYLGLEESRFRFKRYTKRARNLIAIGVVCLFFSPFLAVFFFFLFLAKTTGELWQVFFKNEAYIRQYNSILQPQTAQKVVSVIGYRIYDEELDGHLSIIKSGNGESLGRKQALMEHPNNRLRHIGLDMKTAKTHIALIGKTGAGKTECIRSISDDVLKNGGGIFFNDGKADIKMLYEFVVQAKENYRETSVKVLNFLKAEKSAESNTFNFLSNQHPVKLVEFLSNLAFKDSNEGNTAYFQNRGKTLLLPVASALYVRNKILNEGLDSEKLRDGMQVLNLSIIFITFYCMCRDIDNIIQSNPKVEAMINDKSVVTTETTFFNNIEKLLAIVIQEPIKRIPIEKELGIEYAFIKEAYTDVYKTLSSYVGNVWNRFTPLLSAVSLVVYSLGKTEGGKKFFSIEDGANNIYTLTEIKIFYNKVKDAFSETADGGESQDTKIVNNLSSYAKDFGKNAMQPSQLQALLKEAFQQKDGSLEKPPADAIQQHAYAQQQWDALFGVFTAYKHIMAQAKSEINPIDVVKENQVLYVLLPPLELSRSQVEILGKIVIMTIKNFAGVALGGEFIGLHDTIKNIAKDIFTPKPFTLVVLDEYGAYPVGDIDTILAQVRSLNMSVILGIQDFASLKTSGSDDTAQKRALANTTKIIFKISDRDVIEWLESMVAEQEVEKSDYKRDASGNLVLDIGTQLDRERVVPIKKTQDADNGFCLMLLGSENDRAVWCQTFLRKSKQENIKLTHTTPIKGINNDLISNYKKGFSEYYTNPQAG